jgi:hypothetical protein
MNWFFSPWTSTQPILGVQDLVRLAAHFRHKSKFFPTLIAVVIKNLVGSRTINLHPLGQASINRSQNFCRPRLPGFLTNTRFSVRPFPNFIKYLSLLSRFGPIHHRTYTTVLSSYGKNAAQFKVNNYECITRNKDNCDTHKDRRKLGLRHFHVGETAASSQARTGFLFFFMVRFTWHFRSVAPSALPHLDFHPVGKNWTLDWHVLVLRRIW